MYEELYIIDQGKRLRVDLSTPSGITLNFKSNIFGDLSKITCSFSYTFKLPFTANNRRILENADDLRATSGMVRSRLKCEFIQNGIPMFTNANLYIDKVESAFNAVMTWGVVPGFQALKDAGKALNQLPDPNTEAGFGYVATTSTSSRAGKDDDAEPNFDNEREVLYPQYNCGIPHHLWKDYKRPGRGGSSSSTNWVAPYYTTGYRTYPMPVVPTRRLVNLINSTFGTKFSLGRHITSSNLSDVSFEMESVEKGVVPLVGISLNEAQLAKRVGTLKGLTIANIEKTLSYKTWKEDGTTGDDSKLVVHDAISFSSFVAPSVGDFYDVGSFNFGTGSSAVSKTNAAIQVLIDNCTLELDGKIRASFTGVESDDLPKISVYQAVRLPKPSRAQSARRGSGAYSSERGQLYKEWVEVGGFEADEETETINGEKVYTFDFSAANFNERMKLEGCKQSHFGSVVYGRTASYNTALIFVFSHKVKTKVSATDITIHVANSDSCYDHNIGIINNLPDIGCEEFIKSLYYMIGAFPVSDGEGNVVPMFYHEIGDNLKNGKTIDWSDRHATSVIDRPSSLSFAVSGYAQNNLYLMKSDNAENDGTASDDKIKYEPGRGVIPVANEVIEKRKTIIQVPFHAPIAYCKQFSQFDCGHTFCCWTLESKDGKRERKWSTPKPIMGVIYDQDLYSAIPGEAFALSGSVMAMRCWKGFAEMENNRSYTYLKRILANPYVIQEKMYLSEIDLLNLDYATPIYLAKYGAYFAIVSITRETNGSCKCEFIKLPEEQ